MNDVFDPVFMEKMLYKVLNVYKWYTGGGLHLIFYGCALVYLLFGVKDRLVKKTFVGYTLLFAVVYAFPLTANVIMKHFIGESVYWRMFWALPIVIVLPFVFVHLVQRLPFKWLQAIVAVGLSVLIGVTGNFVYIQATFERPANLYKVPESVPLVCEVVKEDAQKQDVEKVKIVVDETLIAYIRQVDAGIYMPYGRNAVRNQSMTGNKRVLFHQMELDVPEYDILDAAVKRESCNYIVWKGSEETEAGFDALGYRLVDTVDQYMVYFVG